MPAKMYAKRKTPKKIPLGSGLAGKAKKKILTRRQTIEKALKDAGA